MRLLAIALLAVLSGCVMTGCAGYTDYIIDRRHLEEVEAQPGSFHDRLVLAARAESPGVPVKLRLEVLSVERHDIPGTGFVVARARSPSVSSGTSRAWMIVTGILGGALALTGTILAIDGAARENAQCPTQEWFCDLDSGAFEKWSGVAVVVSGLGHLVATALLGVSNAAPSIEELPVDAKTVDEPILR